MKADRKSHHNRWVRTLGQAFGLTLLAVMNLAVLAVLIALVETQPVDAVEMPALATRISRPTVQPALTSGTSTPTAPPVPTRVDPLSATPEPLATPTTPVVLNQTVEIRVTNVISTADWLPVAEQILPPCASGEKFYLALGGNSFSQELTTGGKRPRRYHPGLDGACRHGRKGGWIATAITDARVIKVYKYLMPNVNTPENPSYDLWSSGRTVVIAFTLAGVRFEAIYGHLNWPRPNSEWPEEGDLVESGQSLGQIGSTGASSGPHLHLGLRYLGEDGQYYFVDPTDYGILATRP